MSSRPLIVFDTNILMDVLLERDGAATLLVELAEQQHFELVVPKYVLFEFRGTALRWVRGQKERLQEMRRVTAEWARSRALDRPAAMIKSAAGDVEAGLHRIQGEVDTLLERLRTVARVPPHTSELHFRGDLRYLEGRPPDRPVDGLKDCRIYEAVLSVANEEAASDRTKILLTKDSDFDVRELIDELNKLGFVIRRDPGQLYGELRPKS